MKQFHVRSAAIAMLLLGISFGANVKAQGGDEAIIIPGSQSRSFMLTNSEAAFFFAETGGLNTSSMQGLNVKTEEYLEDYLIEVDGAPLMRNQADAYLYPTKLVRKYQAFVLEEEISLVDSLPILMIKLDSPNKQEIAITPIIAVQDKNNKIHHAWSDEDNILYLSAQARIQKAKQVDIQPLAAVCTFPASEFLSTNISTTYQGNIKQDTFIPGKLTFLMDGTAYVFVIIGENKTDILQKRKEALRRFNIYYENSSKKIDGVRQT